jgi:hypothetical protein
MGGRRVTADRRYENGESGDYSQDIFNLHSLSSFLVQPGIGPTYFRYSWLIRASARSVPSVALRTEHSRSLREAA